MTAIPTTISAGRAKIKVCHLAMGDLWAGAEVQLATLLASLRKIPDLDVSAVLFNEGRLASELRALGIATHVIPESRHNPLSLVRQLVTHFGRHHTDILHTHKYKDNILGVLSSIYRGIPYRVRTVHGLPEPFWGFQAMKMKMYQIVDDCMNRWLVDRILAVSLDLRKQLIKRFGAQKVTCVHNAIDVERMRPTACGTDLKQELNLNGTDFLIGAVGRLMPVKGFDCFLRAARIIRRERADVKFIIAGDGPLKKSLRAMACEYDLAKDVLFLGHRDDSHEILALLDVFVLPSLSEGIPLILLEALALAQPVVATRVGGIPEVIEHGVSGILVMPAREDELAENCIGLLGDRAFARRLGIAGRERVEECFSARIMGERVAELYRSLSGRGEAR